MINFSVFKKAVLTALILTAISVAFSACNINTASESSVSSEEESLSSSSQEESEPEASPAESVDNSVKIDEDTPSDVVNSFMEALRSFDVKGIKDYITVGDENRILNPDDVTQIEKWINPDIVKAYLNKVDYNIKGESVQGETAKVEIELTTPDIGDAAAALAVEVTKYATNQAFKGQPIDTNAFIADYIANKVDIESLPTVTSTAAVTLYRQENGLWLIANDSRANYDLLDAVTGDVREKLEGFSKLMK